MQSRTAFRAELASVHRDLRRADHLARRARVVEPLHVAVLRLGDPRDARVQRIRNESEVTAGLDLDEIEVAIGGVDVAVGLLAGLLREQLDGAADRVLAGQGALRTAQHLDTVEVGHVEVRAEQQAVVDIIHIDTDTRLEARMAVALADTANEGLRRGAVGIRALGEGDVRCQPVEIHQALHVTLVQLRSSECRDGHRSRFQALLAELRGNDNFLQECRARRGCW